MLEQLLFGIITVAASYLFARNISKIRRNILLGRDANYTDQPGLRWKTMALVAMGQKKMFTRPLAAFFHFFIYVGFILINIEVLEILIDGLFGTHRVFAKPLGQVYAVAIDFFEVLAFMVILGCVVFLLRRIAGQPKRLASADLDGQPRKDAFAILFIEIILMKALLILNAVDQRIGQLAGEGIGAGHFPVSRFLVPLLDGLSLNGLHTIERIAWWAHILGIFAFMNYLPFSKHFHIIMAFPNTWYSRLQPKGEMDNMPAVTTEVQLMLDPSAAPPEGYTPPTRFGARDVHDLTWKNLMDAYTCTECGRCSSVCPANITGKKLSPRKIMMDTRDRIEEVGKVMDAKGAWEEDGKTLHDRISAEELWACTTCNACVEACPVNISPVEIITDMRRYLVMEQSAAPQELNMMFTNAENNGAPWQFAQSERAGWVNEG